MKNRGLIKSLCSLLDRGNDDLVIIILTFLKKMSIYVENKDEMVRGTENGFRRFGLSLLFVDTGSTRYLTQVR